MAILVKILKDDDGEKVLNPKWHLSVHNSGTSRALCTEEAYGIGDSSCEFELKNNYPKGITCDDCKRKIKWFKSIKL